MKKSIVISALVVTGVLACLMSSCNVTRTITSTAQTIQKGDTTVVIMTRTVESYDGKVDATKLLNK